jgi:hypothetical protein
VEKSASQSVKARFRATRAGSRTLSSIGRPSLRGEFPDRRRQKYGAGIRAVGILRSQCSRQVDPASNANLNLNSKQHLQVMDWTKRVGGVKKPVKTSIIVFSVRNESKTKAGGS